MKIFNYDLAIFRFGSVPDSRFVTFVYSVLCNREGKNQATKEDIREITKEIEEAKSQFVARNKEIEAVFNKQNEELKFRLSLNNQHILNLKTRQIEALIEFGGSVHQLVQMANSFATIPKNSKELKDASEKVHGLVTYGYEIINVNAKVELLIDDSDLQKLGASVINQVFDVLTLTTVYMDKIKLELSERKVEETTQERYDAIISKYSGQYLIDIKDKKNLVNATAIQFRRFTRQIISKIEPAI
ncbi:hypothetical protein MKQ70_16595 [Chitinophaga sedimenti]|uniref:hypothetical protein n=1 Tax=Chitinophaga sedimenti TaxID=2033606 RepID=UPI00200521B5|nr:hypothetical protein [Chitinophaga sedimenti]MCK7556548.1 hypothetical protein [Chitinophaga sedimenti]